MLHEAVARYHELLAQGNVADETRALLDAGLERSKLIFGGRRLSPYLRPHFVLEEDFARVTKICETVWSAIQKVKDAAIEDHALIDELGLTEIERDLITIDPGYKAGLLRDLVVVDRKVAQLGVALIDRVAVSMRPVDRSDPFRIVDQPVGRHLDSG